MIQKLEYKYQNFYSMVEANAASHPNTPVILIDESKITNMQFLQKVDAFARFLKVAGIVAGDRIALIMPNCDEFIIAVYAGSKVGAVIVPLNNMLKGAEYEFILNDANIKMLVTSNQFVKEVKSLIQTTTVEKIIWLDEGSEMDENNILFSHAMTLSDTPNMPAHPNTLDDLAIIFYTSGTTGNPKGAMMSYRNIFSNMIGGMQRFNVTNKDRFIVYLPMFHSFTFSVMVMLPFYSRSSIVIIRKLLPFANIIKQTLLKRVTVFLGVPDIYNALIRAKLPWYFLWFNSIRLFISGGSPLHEDTLTRFKKIFKRAKMLEGYGLSECSPAVAVNPLDRQKPLSIGLPLDSYEVKIVDDELMEVPIGTVGELIVKGDCVMLGYLNNPTATKDTIINGWLRTGDLGKVDDEGYLYIVDRMKDLIISKGINIYPRQIEEELIKLDFVKAAAVIGIPDTNSGEVPIAYVELEEDVDKESITQASVKKLLKEQLANFKIPKTITFIDELPKNATGKVLKRVLKEELREKGEI